MTLVTNLQKMMLALGMGASICACIPTTHPAPPHQDATNFTATPESLKSAAVRSYYTSIQQMLLSQGLLRTDSGEKDAPFSDRDLAQNFMQIALRDEYYRRDERFIRGDNEAILRRWQAPVRVGLNFGASVSPQRQAKDRAAISAYLARLSRATGHSITLSSGLNQANFIIHILSEDERAALAPSLQQTLPGLSANDLTDVAQMSRNTYCLVFAAAAGDSGVYTKAIAIVRAEHPDLLRLSCYHEEIAQGLGLANDSPGARPSIFNDDEEFALLTPMDELLLRILYDPKLRPGMTAQDAKPLVYSIAARLMAGES